MFLHLELLEFDKLGAAGLQIKPAATFIDFTVISWTHE